MANRRRPRTGRYIGRARGLSVIDSLIAFVLVVIAVLALVGAVPFSVLAANRSAVQLQAISVAGQYLDAVRKSVTANGNVSIPLPPAIAVDAGESMLGTGQPAVSPGDFTITNNGCPLVSGSSLRYDCAVAVRWGEGDADHSFTLETYVTHQ